jgi:hypothetical protein
MAVVTIEDGTLAIEVGLVFNISVVFLSTYFLFRQYRQIIRRLACQSIGNAHLTARCTSLFLISPQMEM